jgi:hypothetical protein
MGTTLSRGVNLSSPSASSSSGEVLVAPSLEVFPSSASSPSGGDGGEAGGAGGAGGSLIPDLTYGESLTIFGKYCLGSSASGAPLRRFPRSIRISGVLPGGKPYEKVIPVRMEFGLFAPLSKLVGARMLQASLDSYLGRNGAEERKGMQEDASRITQLSKRAGIEAATLTLRVVLETSKLKKKRSAAGGGGALASDSSQAEDSPQNKELREAFARAEQKRVQLYQDYLREQQGSASSAPPLPQPEQQNGVRPAGREARAGILFCSVFRGSFSWSVLPSCSAASVLLLLWSPAASYAMAAPPAAENQREEARKRRQEDAERRKHYSSSSSSSSSGGSSSSLSPPITFKHLCSDVAEHARGDWSLNIQR